MISSNTIIEQTINKILDTGDISIITQNNLTEEYFYGYEDEYYFIMDHYDEYGKVPDKLTFLDQFEDFNSFSVNETDEYLYRNLYNQRLYNFVADIWEDAREEILEDPLSAMEKFKQRLENGPKLNIQKGIDIIAKAKERFLELKERATDDRGFYIKTGFEELDTVINGWNRGEELILIFGRTGEGKTWSALKSLLYAWQSGNRVGLISPEMSPSKIGYRLDALMKGFSNTALITGNITQDVEQFNNYENYINELSTHSNSFIVADVHDFNKRITVSKLRQFVINNNLDILAIDGITYLQDERKRYGDNKTTMLTNISEDLMALSKDLKIPVMVIAQSNRGGAKATEELGTPELENVSNSDGMAQNATIVIAVRQVQDRLELGVKKNRNGKKGDSFSYYFDPDVGDFRFTDSERERASYQSTPKVTYKKQSTQIEKPTNNKKLRAY